jgi:hypothetical protein
MTRKQAIKEMRAAFARLTKTQRERLRWHARNKTPILCGPFSHMYVSAEDAKFDPPPGGA